MATDLEIRALIHFETASDGRAVRLIIEDAMGHPTGIILPIDILTALLMTLPSMASSAVKRANDDPSVRITHPLREFQVELSPRQPLHSDNRDAGRLHSLIQLDGGAFTRAWRGAPERHRCPREDALKQSQTRGDRTWAHSHLLISTLLRRRVASSCRLPPLAEVFTVERRHAEQGLPRLFKGKRGVR